MANPAHGCVHLRCKRHYGLIRVPGGVKDEAERRLVLCAAGRANGEGSRAFMRDAMTRVNGELPLLSLCPYHFHEG